MKDSFSKPKHEKQQCEYCGRWVIDLESTPEVGLYFMECLKLTMANCRIAINELKKRAHERYLERRGEESKQ